MTHRRSGIIDKITNINPFENKNKSFKYVLKRIGPNIDPGATPHNNSLNKLNILLILTLCVLLFN